MKAGTQQRHVERALRVFVSYRRADEAAARGLRRASDAVQGVELYELPSDKTGAEDWRQPVSRLISTADAVVCLAGPTACESKNILWELEEATKRGIPVLMVGSSASALAGKLEGTLETIDDHAGPEEILTRLKELA
jgi:hypothetical protein